MPCDGVAVMLAQVQRNTNEVVAMLKGFGLPMTESPLRDGVQLFTKVGDIPIRIAVTASGITAITMKGTFAQGKAALQAAIVESLKAKGVDLANLRFEQHRHDGVAPKLAYAQPHKH